MSGMVAPLGNTSGSLQQPNAERAEFEIFGPKSLGIELNSNFSTPLKNFGV
jgi:hypothetical protein